MALLSIVYLAKYLHSDLFLQSLVFCVCLTGCCILMLTALLDALPSEHIYIPERGTEVTPTSQSCSQQAVAWPLSLRQE